MSVDKQCAGNLRLWRQVVSEIALNIPMVEWKISWSIPAPCA